MMARFDGASSGLGFSTMFLISIEAVAEAAVFDRLYVEHAVGGNHFAFDDLRGQHRALGLIEDIDHLL